VPTRFARQDYFPQGWQTSVAQFLGLFHRYDYICKPISGGSWFSAESTWKLTDAEILKAVACAHPRYFLGCRAGKSTRFAVLDIDVGSRHHNKQSLQKLLKVLSDANLPHSSLFRSSTSGGWHLYLFFDEPVNSATLREQLAKLLVLHDFQVTKGQLEIFPSPRRDGSCGLGLRLPLQPGFAWLNKDTLEVEHERSELNATQALELFLDLVDGNSNSYLAFRNLRSYVQELEHRREITLARMNPPESSNVVPIRINQKPQQASEFADFVKAVFQKIPPGIIVDNWYKGRLFHLNGLTAPSQRAEAIECLGHYLFYGDPSRDLPAMGYGYEQEREWALTEFLSARHNGQSKDINRGRADALAQVERAANWKPAHRKHEQAAKYRTERPIAWIRANANRKSDARRRIAEALQVFKGRKFLTTELQEAANCSRQTLYKHQDLWRARYEDIAEDFFASCTGEYNVVVGGGSAKTAPPSTSNSENMPPGRLAARRIAYELSMREARQQKQAKKASVRSLEAAESDWLAKVNQVSSESAETPEKLKAVLVVLLAYLAMAPNEEGQRFVQARIAAIRSSLQEAECQGLKVVRPPP